MYINMLMCVVCECKAQNIAYQSGGDKENGGRVILAY